MGVVIWNMPPCKSGLLPEGLPCINNNIELEIVEPLPTSRRSARANKSALMESGLKQSECDK